MQVNTAREDSRVTVAARDRSAGQSARRVRLVQVGLGFWGYDWAKAVLPTVETVEVAAYVDRDPAVRRRVQAELGAPPTMCFASLREALAAVECDAVLASLPTAYHAEVAREALAAGKHVIVEKPFVPTLEEGAELVAAAEAAGRHLMVSQNYRHYPASIAAAEFVREASLGRLLAIAIDFRRYASTKNYRYWEIPDPLLADMTIHHFDLMRMVSGEEPVEIACRTWNPPGSPFRHDPSGTLTVGFARGTVVSYRGSWQSRGPATAWAGEWQMDFERGAVSWTSRGDAGLRLKAERLTVHPLDGEEAAATLEPIRHYDRAGTIAAFADAILTGHTPERFSSGRDNLRSLALTAASIQSAARGGAPVRVADLLPPGFA